MAIHRELFLMAGRSQLDLFKPDTPPDMFGADAPAVVYRADPDKVRRRLERILAEARAAETMPWDSSQRNLYKTIFPQMTNWLPEEEAKQYCLQFEQEWERLMAA
jgi:hypothetical protein